jgi:hypothetical protein
MLRIELIRNFLILDIPFAGQACLEEAWRLTMNGGETLA